MCGIAGYLDASAATPAERLDAIGAAMARRLAHRGPDDEGTWSDPAVGIVLAHRRLSVLDLSSEGHQPMLSADSRYVVSYNGEIYNYRDIAEDLSARGAVFRGRSDTEVLLAAIVAWGLEAAAQRFRGMFAIALWDRLEKQLHLLRDRFGEKPLYYGWSGGRFLFGSELKAIAAVPGTRLEIDPGAVALYLRHGQVPAPHCIFRGFAKVPPGTIVSARPERRGTVERHAYWSARDAVVRAKGRPFEGDAEEAVAELHRTLMESVRIRMVSDVPLGAFLSGGIDSSTVVALMQDLSSRPVKTFTIGFRDAAYDEAPYARAVARALSTEHTELYVTGDDALSVVPELPRLYDEPFADASQIPTCLVARLARRSVTVGLSGDGGDELFGGYARYRIADRLWRLTGWLPQPARALAGRLAARTPQLAWRGALRLLAPDGVNVRRRAPEALRTLSRLVGSRDATTLYRALLWDGTEQMAWARTTPVPPPGIRDEDVPPCLEDFIERMMFWDTVGYLPDDILTKVDRASMAVGLEARVPFLDPRVFDLAWRLPLNVKVREGVAKWPIRRILERYVPRALVDRPKMGFSVPLASWLRGPLLEWARDLLAPERLERQGLLEPAPFAAMLTEHLMGTRDRHNPLWSALVLQAWIDARPAATSDVPTAPSRPVIGVRP